MRVLENPHATAAQQVLQTGVRFMTAVHLSSTMYITEK